MFSRNLSRVEGKGRDGRPLAETETTMVKGRGGVGVSKEEEEEATNTSGSFFSRSTARASVKKSRPHSWHSTLQVVRFIIINTIQINIIIIFYITIHDHDDDHDSEGFSELGAEAADGRRTDLRERRLLYTVSILVVMVGTILMVR